MAKLRKDSIGGKQTCIYGHFRNDIAYQWGKEVLSSSFLLSLMVLEKLVISLSKLNSQLINLLHEPRKGDAT